MSSQQLGENEDKGDDDFYQNAPQQSQPEQTSSMIPYYGNKNDGNLDDFAMIVETDDVPDLRVIHLILVCLRRVQKMI